ncbi:hypothetical protein RhiirA5_437465 [Rhizophagus irregularis]|uniref:Uncharacterized protein n=1 Tax=Rhizophagus irregularis TaxID=588596 RepID=A0A2N0NKF2_9GLOM|nr:hypothetical protein RhiirA5_437465 [Rhizophagus irregularis]
MHLGMISDKDKDHLEKHFADRSHDITFYDVPAYWSDGEIFTLLNDNVGFVEYMKTKRCYKYKTVRVTLRFSNAYEKIYKEGGIKDKFHWQASKQLGEDIQQDDCSIIKDYVKIYRAFFEKVIRVNGMRFLILYFHRESDLMIEINTSIEIHDIGCGLWIKKLNDYIDKSGNLQELVKRNDFQNTASSSSGTLIGRQQLSRHVNSLKPQKQWR